MKNVRRIFRFHDAYAKLFTSFVKNSFEGQNVENMTVDLRKTNASCDADLTWLRQAVPEPFARYKTLRHT